jgi:hypothetical protein
MAHPTVHIVPRRAPATAAVARRLILAHTVRLAIARDSLSARECVELAAELRDLVAEYAPPRRVS